MQFVLIPYEFLMHYLPLVAALDKIEAALGKFTDGPFFLGQFSLVSHISLGTL
jgi:hypothetical protein